MKRIRPIAEQNEVSISLDGLCVSLSYYKAFGYFRCNDDIYKIGHRFKCPGWLFDKIIRAPRFTKRTMESLGLKLDIIDRDRGIVILYEL